ncbi:Uncharacterised protein [Mycobacteroides abscessus subsp. abscessus]|nr:Uncharacterised protein [Mycobacteroides abscessus subsp. abscessus]
MLVARALGLSSLAISSRASRVRAGLLARISTLLVRGSAIAVMRLVASPLAPGSIRRVTSAATSVAMPFLISIMSVATDDCVSTLAMMSAMRRRLSA